MLVCKKCGFAVNGGLKHSIKTNQCPSCGSALLANEELKQVSSIARDLSLNGFNYSKIELRMLAIFFVNKLSPKEEEFFEEEFDGNDDLNFADQQFDGEELSDPDEYENDLSKIREEVSQEYKLK